MDKWKHDFEEKKWKVIGIKQILQGIEVSVESPEGYIFSNIFNGEYDMNNLPDIAIYTQDNIELVRVKSEDFRQMET